MIDIPLPLLFVAFLGGVIPALLWLFFWLLEDRCEPEPKKLIFLSFLGGAIAVPLVLPFQQLAMTYLSGVWVLVAWAIVEEVFKLVAAYCIALRNRALDEPIDAIIYMITAALGFSALENTLFLIGPLQGGDAIQGLITGNLRFIGATLLHTLASATIGISIAISFYKSKTLRRIYFAAGVTLAVVLHIFFNFFILKGQGSSAFTVFLFVWIGIVIMMLFFERVKKPARNYC
jgi:protease PrsW